MSGKKIYKQVLEYNKRGWITHPLTNPKDDTKDAGKIPIIPGYQKLKFCETEDKVLRNWYCKNGCNVGLLCGKKNNVTVIDFDSYKFKEFLFEGLNIKTMFDKRTKGRGHYWFKYEPSLEYINRHNTLGIEIFTGDNHQIVMPPSVHASGEEYKWYNKRYGIQKMPTVLVKRIKSLILDEKYLMECILRCRPWVKSVYDEKLDVHDEDTMVALSSELKKNGLTIKQMHIFCIVMLGKNYNKNKTIRKWSYIKGIPWKYKTLRERLPAHIQIHLKKQSRDTTLTERVHNPQAVDSSIVARAKLLRNNYWIVERTHGNVEFHDRKNNKLVARLRLSNIDEKWYDDNYKNTGITKEVTESNSAFYYYYLSEMRTTGLPMGRWQKQSDFCKIRVYKRQSFDDITGMHMTEMFIICKSRLTVDNEWLTIDREGIPYYTEIAKLTPASKRNKIRLYYTSGITDIKILQTLFGYKSKMGVYKVIKDLKTLGRNCKITNSMKVKED